MKFRWWRPRRKRQQRHGLVQRMAFVIGAMLANNYEDNYVPDLCKVTNMGEKNMHVTLAHMERAGLVRSGIADDGSRYYVLTKKALEWSREALQKEPSE